jgi:tetratricopeptide (TPR) repeat protein
MLRKQFTAIQNPASLLDTIYRLVHKGQFEQAFNWVLHLDPRFIEDDFTRDRYYFARGRCLYGLNQFENAIAAYKCVDKWTSSPKALNCLAYCYQKLGHQDVAHELFNQEAVLELLELGTEYLDAGLFMKALRAFQSIPDWHNSYEAINGVECVETCLGEHERAKTLRSEIELKWPASGANKSTPNYSRLFVEPKADSEKALDLTAVSSRFPK